jgi:hypothetical protein
MSYPQRQNKKAKTAVPELNYASNGQRVWEKIGIDLIDLSLLKERKHFTVGREIDTRKKIHIGGIHFRPLNVE